MSSLGGRGESCPAFLASLQQTGSKCSSRFPNTIPELTLVFVSVPLLSGSLIMHYKLLSLRLWKNEEEEVGAAWGGRGGRNNHQRSLPSRRPFAFLVDASATPLSCRGCGCVKKTCLHFLPSEGERERGGPRKADPQSFIKMINCF